jgi:hypothetical protein
MNHRLAVAACAALLVVGFVAAYAARAQSAPTAVVRDFYGEAVEDLDPPAGAAPPGMVCGNLSVDAGLTMQTVEPLGGFTGACLTDPRGGPLPAVCYSPNQASYTDGGTTVCSIPAANVTQPSWWIHVDPNSGAVARQPLATQYRRLVTCVPSAGGACPGSTTLASRSCCTSALPLTATSSGDGGVAQGTALFTL